GRVPEPRCDPAKRVPLLLTVSGLNIRSLHCCDDPIAPGRAPVAFGGVGTCLCSPVVSKFFSFYRYEFLRHSSVERELDLQDRWHPIGRKTTAAPARDTLRAR